MPLLRGILIAFSMFSAIPVPTMDWDSKSMRYMLCGFPLIGVLVALLTVGWAALSAALGLGAFLRGAGLLIVPVAVTGGIHLDGFCDTADALASHASPERKRDILKDPSAGAFAVIGTAVYLIAYFALCTELRPDSDALWLISFGFVMERCLSGLSVLLFPASGTKGLLFTFRFSAEKQRTAVFLIALFFVCALAMVAIAPLPGALMVLAALLCLGYLYYIARAKFGGMSGDLAGFFLQICEIVMLAVLVFTQKAVAL